MSSEMMAVIEMAARWRATTSRHLAVCCGFRSLRYCEKILLALTREGYLKRNKVIVGQPMLYTSTKKTFRELGYDTQSEWSFSPATVEHELGLADIMTWQYIVNDCTIDDLITDRDILLFNKKNGIKKPLHRADLVTDDGKITTCFEYERTPKKLTVTQNSKMTSLTQIFIANLNRYEKLVYVYPEHKKIIRRNLELLKNKYNANLEIYSLEEIQKIINEYDFKSNALRRNLSVNLSLSHEIIGGKKNESVRVPHF